ncbi:MAG: hypothetical protein WC928_01425 [Patescibacteria group bacterium]|jgi:hypothetical protein
MFENFKDNQEEKIEDIFEESEQKSAPSENLNNSAVRPEPYKVSGNQIGNKMAKAHVDEFEDSSSRSGKILKTIFLILIILVIVGIGAYFVYSKVLLPKALDFKVEDNNVLNNNFVEIAEKNGTTTEDDGATEESGEEIGLDDESDLNDNFIDITGEDGSLELLKNIDTDLDILSDYDEIYVHNTDPYVKDTDVDGLSDYDEIIIFGTDPLSYDTDGDGYLDGQEVMGGYNPLGTSTINSILFKDQNLFFEKYPNLVP